MLRLAALAAASAAALAFCAPASGALYESADVIAGAGPGYPARGAFSGDGGPATRARLAAPAEAAWEPGGSVLVVDSFNRRVRRVRPDGRIVTVAGSSESVDCGDDVPALKLCLAVPHGVLSDRHGGFWVADTFNHKVRHVDAAGRASTAAGSGGPCGFPLWECRQAGPARDVPLHLPINVKPGLGGLIITDAGSHRILRLAGGVLSVVAGTGRDGFSGDGGPGPQADISMPQDAVAYRGGVLIADGGNCRLRWVGPDGIIRPFAGYGLDRATCQRRIILWRPGYRVEGDGGPALDAGISVTAGVAVVGGDVYVSDFLSGRIRRIRNGKIVTAAGTGARPHLPATKTAPPPPAVPGFVYPAGLAAGPGRQLLVADPGNQRIWKLKLR